MEERFAQRLGSNDLPVRNKALKRLSKWVEERSALKDGKIHYGCTFRPRGHRLFKFTGFTEMELLKLWKGLHVCMWHSDKPLVQVCVCASVCHMIHFAH